MYSARIRVSPRSPIGDAVGDRRQSAIRKFVTQCMQFEIGNWKLEIGNLKSEIRDLKFEIHKSEGLSFPSRIS